MSNDEYGFDNFPNMVNAVLDLMPTGAAWRARFAEEPGLSVLPPDTDGFITVMHKGDVVMKLANELFRRGATHGQARIVVDGQWQDIELQEEPEAPDTIPGEWLE